MPSLPTVGGSNNTWGTELNTWLTTSLNTDASLKAAAVAAALGYTPINKAGDTGVGALGLGSNALTAGSLIIGTNPAASGTLRIPNAAWIAGRNQTNAGDVNLWRVNTSNVIESGASLAHAGPVPWIDVTHSSYGADKTGAVDATTAINNAIAAAPATGAVIYCPAGLYKIDGTIDLRDKHDIRLIGAGGRHDIYGTFSFTSRNTIFKRSTGTGAMVRMGTNALASACMGQWLKGISIDCSTLATYGVHVESLRGGGIADVHIRDSTSIGLYMTTINTAGDDNVQLCEFGLEGPITVSQAGAGASGTAHCIKLDSYGPGGGNVSHNTFGHIQVYHTNGNGWIWGDSDSNETLFYTANGGGTGIGLELLGCATNAFTGHCRTNSFGIVTCNVTTGSGVVSRGTGMMAPAKGNIIACLNQGDVGGLNPPDPTIEAGSTLYWSSTRGGAHYDKFHMNNASWLVGRNNANSADVNIVKVNTSDLLEFPGSTFLSPTTGAFGVGIAPDSGFIDGAGTHGLVVYRNSGGGVAAVDVRNDQNSGDGIVRAIGKTSGAVTVTLRMMGYSGGYGDLRTTSNHPLAFGMNNAETFRITSTGFTFAEAKDITLGTTSGTRIGTGTTQKLGFWNATPVARGAAWTITNVTTDRTYDANTTTIDELADALGTLIAELQTMGLLS